VGLPTGLPDSAWINARYGATGDKATRLALGYDLVVPIALDAIARDTGLVFYDASHADEDPEPPAPEFSEILYFSGRIPYLVPSHYPVTSLTSALASGRRALSLGARVDVVTGAKQLSIADEGAALAVARGALAAGEETAVVYRAGYSVLPDALVEVFTELVWTIAHEPTRIGKTNEKVGELQTTYTRELPKWARRTLDGFKRPYGFV
jgi:hypothetical protein